MQCEPKLKFRRSRLEIEVLKYYSSEQDGAEEVNGWWRRSKTIDSWNDHDLHSPHILQPSLTMKFFIVPFKPRFLRTAIGTLSKFVGEDAAVKTLLMEHLDVTPHSKISPCILSDGKPTLFGVSIPYLED